jgi:transcriptional antiterminator RfaH
MNISDTLDPNIDGPRWFAVQTRRGKERQARFHLENQGYEHFLPLFPKTRRHARKMQTVLSAFFPGYLFVWLDITQERWRPINGTFGVSRLVMETETRPKPVPPGVVEALHASVDGDGVLQLDDRGDLAIGNQVRVIAGPFTDQLGKLTRLDGHGRVQVLLKILGGSARVELDRGSVAAA